MNKCLHYLRYKAILNNNFTSCILKRKCVKNLPFVQVCSESSCLKHKEKQFLYVDEFNSMFQMICHDLTRNMDKSLLPVSERIKKIFEYNISSGKKIRGLIVIMAYEMLHKTRIQNADDLKLAMILGWCVEMLQGFFIVSDDVMDNSITRRGKDCWFRLPDVKLQAINDAILIKESIFRLLRRYFSEKNYYLKIVEEFNEITEKTAWGQTLDMLSNPTGQKPQLESFTLDYYWKIIQYKTSYYTFCLPVNLAMHLIGNFNETDFSEAQDVCLKLGKLFQVQDDYLDVYGDSIITGKIGKDIQEGKCTWFAVTALLNSTSAQKKIFKDNYGVMDSSSVDKILEIYNALLLKEKYALQEAEIFSEIISAINKMNNSALNKELFINILDILYKREK